MERYIHLTGKVAIYLNSSKISAVKPAGSGCIVYLDNGATMQVKETYKEVIHKIFGII